MITIFFVRLVLAWIFFSEGTKKLFAWFGGGGIESLSNYFSKLGIPFPGLSAHLVGYTELFSGLCFLVGFLVKPAAAAISIIMAVAIFTAHREGGFNYPLLVLSVCALLFQTGAGNFSLDRYTGKLRRVLVRRVRSTA